MKPFISIATPHRDILEGRLTLDIFAADLWQVFRGEAPEEYKDPDIFFRRTFLTAGLRHLLDITENRLKGSVGDSVIQLQTPFGGGKTHALIALYHKAKEWNSKVVVIDGTVFDPNERTLWEEMELQLTGKIASLMGRVAPGREKIYALLSQRQPLLILIDELLEYITKASGVKVGDTTLASQTLAFIQELTMTIKTLPKAMLILTLPSSLLEHYDENAEKLFQQIQHITGRMEKVYTPVEDEEVSSVIVKRLFSHIDEREAKNNIEEFLNYIERENILPEGTDKSLYREKFIKSFPFQPEVIDILYKRWGSFPSFQRTRGVLRILALIVHSLKNSTIPFIRLGDIDLKNEEIRRELIKHIGNEFDSILASDITSADSGAKKVDRNLGSAYLPYSLGTKCATTIFLYSFSGGHEKGITLQELKLNCAEPSHPSSIIVEVVEQLKGSLFYISDHGLFFTNQPNLNRIHMQKEENIEERNIEIEERKLLEEKISKRDKKFQIYIWPEKTKDIPDTRELKLIILKDYSKEICVEFLERCGDRPRVYRNTLIFLCPSSQENKTYFRKIIKKKLAWELIKRDPVLNLNEKQKKEVEERIEKLKEEVKTKIRDLYRLIIIPSREGLREINLGIPTYGREYMLDEEVYNMLKSEVIMESIAPFVIIEKYLKNDYISTKAIFDSFYTTPGEIRIVDEKVLKEAIKKGVKEGLFGLGRLAKETPICKYFKEDCSPELSDEEIIIKKELCKDEIDEKAKKIKEPPGEPPSWKPETSKEESEGSLTSSSCEEYSGIYLTFDVPFGNLSVISDVIRFIRSKFSNINIKIEISAYNGNIRMDEFEDKILEALKQIGLKESDINVHLKN